MSRAARDDDRVERVVGLVVRMAVVVAVCDHLLHLQGTPCGSTVVVDAAVGDWPAHDLRPASRT